MGKLDNIILKILKISAYIAVFLPLFVNDNFYYPYIVPRTTIFRIIVEIMVLLFIFLVLRNREFLKRLNWIHLTIFFFIAWLFVAGIAGVNFYKSFWGTMQRSEGIFSLLHYFAFLIIISNIFREKKDWIRIFNFAALTSFLICVYAIFQYLGISAITYESGADRATGTIGNAGFFATFLVFAIFINLILFINKLKDRKDDKNRLYLLSFYCLNLLLNFVGLIIANTRGAILGLAIGASVLFWYFIKFATSSEIRKKIIYILIAVILIIFVLFLFRNTDFVGRTLKLGRIFNMFDITAQQRLYAWRVAFTGFKENPVMGVGPENYSYIFNKYFDTDYLKISSLAWFDRAHNIVFEILTTSGIVGFILYSIVCLFIFGYLYRLWKGQVADKKEIIFLAVLLGVYFIQNLFIFDTVNSYLMLCFVLGFISFLIAQNKESTKLPEEKNIILRVSFFKKILTFIIIILILIGIVINFRQFLASFYGAEAYKASFEQFKNANLVFAKYDKFISINAIGTIEPKKEFAAYFIKILDSVDVENLNTQSKEKLDNYAVLISRMLEEEIAKANFSDAKDVLALGRFYQMISRLYPDRKSEILDKSTNYYEKSISLSSNKYYIYSLIAQNKIALENYQEAISYLEKSLSIDPEYGGTYWLMSVAYSGLKDNKKSVEYLKKAIEYKVKFENLIDIKYAIQLIKDLKDSEILIYLYEEMIRIDPEDPQPYASLAYVYFQFGEFEKARQATMQAWALNPLSEADVKEFLKKIDEAEKNKK